MVIEKKKTLSERLDELEAAGQTLLDQQQRCQQLRNDLDAAEADCAKQAELVDAMRADLSEAMAIAFPTGTGRVRQS